MTSDLLTDHPTPSEISERNDREYESLSPMTSDFNPANETQTQEQPAGARLTTEPSSVIQASHSGLNENSDATVSEIINVTAQDNRDDLDLLQPSEELLSLEGPPTQARLFGRDDIRDSKHERDIEFDHDQDGQYRTSTNHK
jgi:hypothetical protein